MTQTLERRGSRAWRLSPAADSAQDAEQHRRQRAWRQRNWVPATSDEISDPEAFFKLFCSSCNCFLSDKGLMMQTMLANESSICFATEKQPQDIVLQDEAGKTPGVCDCKVRDMEACGCGARLGYHLLSACEVCEESGTRQRWFLCPRCVEAEPAEPVDLEATEPVAAPPPALATPRFAADSPPQFGEAAIAAVPLPRILAERDQQAEEPADRSEAELAKREAELTRRERLVTQKEEELKTLESQLQAQASQAQVQQGVPTPCKPVVSRRAERPQAPTPALQTQMTPQLTTQMTPQVSQTPHTQTIPQMTPPQMSQMTQMTHQERHPSSRPRRRTCGSGRRCSVRRQRRNSGCRPQRRGNVRRHQGATGTPGLRSALGGEAPRAEPLAAEPRGEERGTGGNGAEVGLLGDVFTQRPPRRRGLRRSLRGALRRGAARRGPGPRRRRQRLRRGAAAGGGGAAGAGGHQGGGKCRSGLCGERLHRSGGAVHSGGAGPRPARCHLPAPRPLLRGGRRLATGPRRLWGAAGSAPRVLGEPRAQHSGRRGLRSELPVAFAHLPRVPHADAWRAWSARRGWAGAGHGARGLGGLAPPHQRLPPPELRVRRPREPLPLSAVRAPPNRRAIKVVSVPELFLSSKIPSIGRFRG
ncbi:unnamed protein product [Effrenium voratum]|nr:unnamed protein product [Effrenium voratum]